NEPPLAYYRFPIIGHTWSFLMDCEKLILESREKYGETFSLCIFGEIVTIAGKETTHEILNKDHDFNLNVAIKAVTKRQKDLIKAIDLHIGECIEPKIIHDPHKTLTKIITIPVAKLIVGEECCNYKDILETFKTLTDSIFKLLYIPPILSFIHPWLHLQFITIPLRFGWNPLSKHKKVIISRIKPIIKKRLYDKKRLGNAWVAPLDGLQCYLDDPEITPDLDPNNVNYNYIVDGISSFIFAAMASTSLCATNVLYG
ncbi:12616_t:CDS:2, partial [Dentiscutata heterogama]